MTLDELTLKDSYSSEQNNIVKEFYNPVLERATSYDRITGYFSPSILAIAARGFAGLLHNNGRIRVISSIQVSKETFDAIKKSENDGTELDVFSHIDFDIDSLNSQLQKDYLKLFIYLYKAGILQLKVAILEDGIGILHQKVGIVRDAAGNALSFSGSNNETPGGAINNHEEFKVFKNWTITSSTYFVNDEANFDKYWNDKAEGAKVIEISDAIKNQLVSILDDSNDIEQVVRRIKAEEENLDGKTANNSSGRELRDYQVDAIKHWIDHGYKSMFEMATGTGKTFTAINALKTFQENNSYLRAVVVVPLTTLTIQWQQDIEKILPNVTVINTSTNSHWKDELNSITFARELGRAANFILVTTYSMFSKSDFAERQAKLGDDLILLADEMHNLVNKNRLAALTNPSYKYKLGLSATPTRLWQPTESAVARLHFGDNSYQYSLADAIKSGFLVPYNYYPLPVHLTESEYEDYVNLSREISRLSQMKSDSSGENTALNMKLIARSRIKKNAENKIPSLENTLRTLQRNNVLRNALIYVDNEEFLNNVQMMLTSNNVRTTKFIGNNSLEERLTAINNLRSRAINAIIAIKCLDEGVDIPSAQVAFFISNNTDPREYVQRLGRVLRLDQESKKDHSDIYDYLVMPPRGTTYENKPDRRIARNMIKNELIRARFFNDLAMNSSRAQEIIDEAVDHYSFYFEGDELIYKIGDEDNELTY